jgi:hypothetical protein
MVKLAWSQLVDLALTAIHPTNWIQQQTQVALILGIQRRMRVWLHW